MMSNLKWVQNSVEPLKIFQIFALLNCFQLSVLLEVQRWRRILPSSTIWSWKCQRMPWGPALRTTRKSLKIQSWSCTIAISLCDIFCNSYVRFVGPFFATSQVEKNYNHGQLPWSKSRAWIWGTLKKLFFHLIDLLVMFFLHDALQVNAMRLVKAQARAVLNEIKKQGQQSWGLSSRAVQSCVRKGSRGYWLGVPFWSSFRWHFWIQKHFCLIKDSMTQCLICNSLDWLQRNTYPFRLWGNIAIDPCRRFCPRWDDTCKQFSQLWNSKQISHLFFWNWGHERQGSRQLWLVIRPIKSWIMNHALNNEHARQNCTWKINCPTFCIFSFILCQFAEFSFHHSWLPPQVLQNQCLLCGRNGWDKLKKCFLVKHDSCIVYVLEFYVFIFSQCKGWQLVWALGILLWIMRAK